MWPADWHISFQWSPHIQLTMRILRLIYTVHHKNTLYTFYVVSLAIKDGFC